MWNLEKQRITAVIFDDIPVQGVVMSSRQDTHGNVCHDVRLDIPIQLYGQARDTVTVYNSRVERATLVI